jgi:hypothetical protein
MTSWFGSRPRTAPAQGGSDYDAARDNERQRQDAKLAESRRDDVNAAYRRGRRDARRRRSPLLSFIVLVIVVAAAALFYLAVQNGSFQNGGAVVDNSISHVSQTATAPIRRAAGRAGDALEQAGQNLKQRAGDQPASNL